jgi:superoxide dismutase, Cu-Zn family
VYCTALYGIDFELVHLFLEDTPYGLLIKPDLYLFPEGDHGFHLHQFPSCESLGKAAGVHWDPKKTRRHARPCRTKGHLGDLPRLFANHKGHILGSVFAPRLHVSDLLGHALIIHHGGDNYADHPQALGGGGARLACAVIPK